ncbi:hypothetical protein MKX01_025297 [Papaver californicum]|nr:hypothetical protein MKX01_025297 [Papaver californicum]
MDSRNLKQETITIVGDHGKTVEMGNSSAALVSLIKEKMESISPSLCIYVVPEILRKGLEAMEKHKWRYLSALLNRKPNLESVLDDCVKAMKQLEQRARKCYEEIISMSSNEFVEMMIVFTIELFLNYSKKESRQRREPIFANSWMLFSVRIIIPGDDDDILHEKFSREGNHLLDLVRNTYLPSYPKKLMHSGIKFKRATDAVSLLNIKFTNGVLKIPPLKIHNHTNNLLRNLIALELCSMNSTMYIHLMCSSWMASLNLQTTYNYFGRIKL